MVSGPLQGVRILDLTHVWAGPLAVRMLADLGAEVTRIEAPDGRGPQQLPYAPLGGWLGGAPSAAPWNDNAMFVKLMRNRRSVCVDLKSEAGRQLLLDLVAEADVLVENFSAHTLDGLGLGYDQLQQANPGLIYLTMPGFGHSGPLADRVAFGPIIEGLSGFTEVFGYGPEEPRNTAMALMDPVSGVNAVAAVTEALRAGRRNNQSAGRRNSQSARRRNNHGARIEMTLHEGGVSLCGPWLLDAQLGAEPKRWGNRHPGMVPHGVFACAGDDAWVSVACANDTQWRALCPVLGAHAEHPLEPSWSLAERRGQEIQIEAALSAYTRQQGAHAVVQALQEAGVPAGVVASVPEMLADPQAIARECFVPYERHATPMPGNPIKMDGLDPGEWAPCPGLGEHNLEVLEDWLGMSATDVERLQAAGVLHDRPPA